MENLGILKTRTKNGGGRRQLQLLICNTQHLPLLLWTQQEKKVHVTSIHFDLVLLKVSNWECILSFILLVVSFLFVKIIW